MLLSYCFWNVQHGSAALVVTPNDKKIAADLGTGLSRNVPFSPLQFTS